MIKTHQIKIEPNAHMLHHINDLFNYRRYIWNQALALWNDRYDESLLFENKSLRPDGNLIRDELVHNKHDWQYLLSARVLQQAVISLDKAWKNYFNPTMPNHHRPRFKSKKNYKPTFTTDRATIINGKLMLDKPRNVDKSQWFGIRLHEKLRFNGELKTCTITQKSDGIYASLAIETKHQIVTPKKQDIAGIDVNVKHFNYNDGIINIYPDKLAHYYQVITHYQKMLARKRLDNPYNYKTKRYTKVKTKLRRAYQRVSNLQSDILQKFTTKLINEYQEIHLEDLDVHTMMMSKKMGKNLQRSLFGRLSVVLGYKCEWNERKLLLVDRLYPSTQICSVCGYRKTKDGYGGKQTLNGDSIHQQHQVYYCYNCGSILDRDENAVQNLINYRNESWVGFTQERNHKSWSMWQDCLVKSEN